MSGSTTTAETASDVRAQTIAFVTWLLGHVCLALNLRSEREPLFRLGLFSNRLMVGWAVATAAFVLLVTMVPGIRKSFHTVALSGREWALAAGAAWLGTFWIEAWKWLFARRSRRERYGGSGSGAADPNPIRRPRG